MAVQAPPFGQIPEQDPGALFLGRIRDLIYKVAGIFHADNRFSLLQDRCARRIGALKLSSLSEYYERLTLHSDRDSELHQLLNEITIGETCFFRNQPQLDAFRQIVLPEVVKNRSRLGFRQLKIWSAGCSTGEEPYTLAMILMEESQGLLNGWTYNIIATDLNDRSVAAAKQATYSDYALRNTPGWIRDKYFRQEGSRFRVHEKVAAAVSVSRVNLLDDSKMLFMRGMDVIFCCNVLIYFDGASKRRVIRHFYSNLVTGGYFFLGHSESLFNVTDDFELVAFPGASAYHKADPKAGRR